MYKKIKNIGFLIFNTIVLGLLNFQTVSAQETKPPEIPQILTLPGPKSGQDVTKAGEYVQQQFLPRIALTVVQVAITLSFIFLIVGAVKLLTAYGNEEKLTPAKKTLMLAVIGLVISLLSYAIVQLIFYTGYRIENV